MRHRLLLTAALAVLSTAPVAARGKEKKNSPSAGLDATLSVNCDEQDPPRQLTVASPTLVADKGGAGAWVKVESGPARNGCHNVTELFITHPNQTYRLAYRQRPEDPDLWGNGMRIVDWSPNGQLLLTEAWQWKTETSDAPVEKRILLFQADGPSVSEIDTDALWADQADRDCFVQVQLLGFTPEGWVALRAHLSTHYDEGEGSKPAAKMCAEKNQVWAIDPVKQSRRLLPDDFQPTHNGTLTKTTKVRE